MSVQEIMGKSSDANLAAPYGGYYSRDVPAPDPELTAVGPGTPMGEYLRSQWQPVCLSEQITDLPLAIRIMGEDLVAFRDKSGRIGILHRHCSHRGTSLEYGIVSERGIRCCYHGWLFDIDGAILETPGEPPDSKLKDSLFHGAYPALEMNGLVFAYMGPMDKKPPFPHREPYDLPGQRAKAFSLLLSNNWLQTYENTMDPVHSVFLHHRSTGTQLTPAFGEIPHVEYQETGNGNGMMYISKRRMNDEMIWVRHVHCIFPNEAHVGTVFDKDYSVEDHFRHVFISRWIVPYDDTSCAMIGWRFFSAELPGGDTSACGYNRIDFGGQTEQPDYETKQRFPGDWEVQAGQRPIAVHAAEHRGATDAGVALMRRLLRRAVRGEAPAAWPAPEGVDDGVTRPNAELTYCQDSVLHVPKHRTSEEDWSLLGDVGRKVTDVLIEADGLEGGQRTEQVVSRLKELSASYVS